MAKLKKMQEIFFPENQQGPGGPCLEGMMQGPGGPMGGPQYPGPGPDDLMNLPCDSGDMMLKGK